MKLFLRIHIIVFLLIFCVSSALATKEKYSNELKAKPLSNGLPSLVIQDHKFGNSVEEAKIDYSHTPVYDNLVLVEIVEDNLDIKPVSTVYKIDLDIKLWDNSSTPNGSPSDTYTEIFYIDYDIDMVKETSYRQYVKYSDYRKIEITVLSVMDMNNTGEDIPEMRVYGEIVASRKYNFNKVNSMNSAQPSFSNAVILQSEGEAILELDWLHYEGAEAYDLEWTFYDKESKVGQKIEAGQGATQASLNELFKNNASRVELEKETYRINLLYPEGYIFYRIRAARYIDGFKEVSNWTTDGVVNVSLDGWSDKIAIGWHEGQNLNWQAQTIFAEEGKNIPSISYFDGSLRQRQSVTLSNSIGHTTVSEPIYDYNGRPALNVMPAPSAQTYIGFQDGWSLQSPGVAYTKAHFDEGDCSVSPLPMDNSAGASSYFSFFNFLNLNTYPSYPENTYYIPDAEGYPYAITEYMPDATGRVKRQGGVGPHLQLDSGHETKYFYSKASQQEIDRLFGNSIGIDSHYFKNMVMDPNGQISVFYLDAHGRTIATALAGESPSQLSAIEGHGAPFTIVRQLLSNKIRDNSLVSTQTFLVTDEQSHQFFYTLSPFYPSGSNQPLSYQPDCLVSIPKCYDCGFDVKVMVTDNCGNSFNGGSPLELFANGSNKNYTDPLNYDCAPPLLYFPNESKNLPVGEYKITKELTLNEDVLQAYLEDFLSSQSCLPSYDAILLDLMNELDATSCEIDCNTCVDDVPMESDILDYLAVDAGNPTLAEQAQASAIRATLLEQCDLLCNAASECEIMAQMMEQDFYPGGQYAEYRYDSDTDTYYPEVFNTETGMYETDVTSIFYNDMYKVLLAGTVYEDEFGTPSMVYYNGEMVAPTEVDVATFIANFQPSWARPLVEKYHPEYCYLSWCENENAASDQWDASLYDISSYAEASMVPGGVIDANGNFINDPFFNGGPGADCIDEMQAYLNHIIPYDSSSPSLVEFVEQTVWGEDCATQFGQGTDAENDLAWQILRQLYLGFKMQIMAAKWDAIPNCNNSCIGNGEEICDGEPCVNTDALDNVVSLCSIGGTNHFKDKISKVVIIPPYNTVDNPVTTEDLYELMEEGTDAIIASCQEQCAEMADAWMYRLESCTAMTPGELSALKAELISICQYGCDVSHPNGASTVPFSDNPNLINPPTYNSFVEAIEFYAQSDICDLDCNPYLIAYPRPYDKETYLGARPVNSLSNSCICERLSEVESYFTNPDGYPVDSEPYREALSSFLLQYSNAPLRAEDIKVIKEQCNSSTPSLYLPYQIYIPPYLECGTCVTLAELNMVLDNVDIVGTCTAVSLEERYELEAIYLNYELGFQLTAEEYQDFLSNPSSTPHLLCPQTPFEVAEDIPSCAEQLYESVLVEAQLIYEEELEALEEQFINEYYSFCLSNVVEGLSMITNANTEYHYTLYYYDQAGNLVQTVPPGGVVPLTGSDLTNVQLHRNPPAGQLAPPVYPMHDQNQITTYEYNALNEMIKEHSPDMGDKQYWYDPLGRVFASQDGRQVGMANGSIEVYSYTEYDDLGRVEEIGEVATSESPENIDWTPGYDVAIVNWTESAQANKSFITHTFYDIEEYTIAAFGGEGQQNLRTRVSSVTFDESGDNDDATYDYASHYSYDAVGNVKVLVQEIQELSVYGSENQYKVIAYDYDHISGKVNAIRYQEGQYDQFTHRYNYDEDNRLTEVWTSEEETDNDLSMLWTREAAYKYYLHGPLSRKELGHYNVQGMDYVYTLQGWIKALNSSYVGTKEIDDFWSRDIGRDGDGFNILDQNNNYIPANRSTYTASDAYGYAIGYFDGDYKNIGNEYYFSYIEPVNYSNPTPFDNVPSLYNGNIRYIVDRIPKLEEGTSEVSITGRTYEYDQLHRLKKMNSWTTPVPNPKYPQNLVWDQNPDDNLKVENITYDPNGNLQSLSRWGTNSAVWDDLIYHYDANNPNRLSYVEDNAPASSPSYLQEFIGHSSANYMYDGAGNLIKDLTGGVSGGTEIKWTPYGKVAEVDIPNELTLSSYHYGPDQNRWVKKEQGEEIFHANTYYIRDAQGNVLATYEEENPNFFTNFKLRDQYLFGSSRLGSYERKIDGISPGSSGNDIQTSKLGNKRYEITNHLGNVIAVINDRKTAYTTWTGTEDITLFKPTYIAAKEYFPFGMKVPGRSYQANQVFFSSLGGEAYRYGFNGKENDGRFQWGGATHYDYGFRIYNPAIGRFLSVDPLKDSYPSWSPYPFAMNRPIDGIDLDGLEWTAKTYDVTPHNAVTKRITYFDVKIKVINSTKTLNTGNLADYKNLLSEKLKSTFSGAEGNRIYEMGDITISFVEKDVARRNNGIVIELSDEMLMESSLQYTGLNSGDSQNNYINVIVGNRDLESVVNTSVHELGHSAGLTHIWEATFKAFGGGRIFHEGAPKDIFDLNEKTAFELLMGEETTFDENGDMSMKRVFKPSQEKLRVLNNVMNSPQNPKLFNIPPGPGEYKEYTRQLESTISQLRQMLLNINKEDGGN